jgi:hypothetical protein
MSTTFYTISDDEANAAVDNMGAVPDGDPFWVFGQGTGDFLTMYHLYKESNQANYFTPLIHEHDIAINEEGYFGQGIAFWLPPSDETDPDIKDLFRAFNPITGDYIYTTNIEEIESTLYESEGAYGAVYTSKVGTELVKLFRFVSSSGMHTYTADQLYAGLLSENGWKEEESPGFVQPTLPGGPAPLYRSYNPETGGHYYAMDILEHEDALTQSNYRGDGIACYIYADTRQPSDAIKLLRCYNPHTGDHFYTTSQEIFDLKTSFFERYQPESFVGWVLSPTEGEQTSLAVPMHQLTGSFASNFFVMTPGPPKSLTSNSNYTLSSNVGAGFLAIENLSIEIEISSDVSVQEVNFDGTKYFGALGFSIQLNTYSPAGFTAAWQQYCLEVNEGAIGWLINNWQNSPVVYGIPSIISGGTVATLEDPVVRAGTSLTITLLSDEYRNIIGAVFRVQNSAGISQSITAYIKDIQDGTAFGSAPIVALQLAIVGPDGGARTTFNYGGAGTIKYSANTPLFIQTLLPSVCEYQVPGTGETGNSVYTEMSATMSHALTQGFTTNGTTY